MPKLLTVGLLIIGVLYLGSNGRGLMRKFGDGNTALLMQGITKNELNTVILDYYETHVAHTSSELSPQMIQTSIGDLDDDGDEDVIATVESASTCGSGGCIASIFLSDEFGELRAINFSYAITGIQILDSVTEGMHDLRINNDQHNRMIWNGDTYEFNRI